MKYSILRHFIWVFNVCQSTPLGVSSIQRVKNRHLIKKAKAGHCYFDTPIFQFPMYVWPKPNFFPKGSSLIWVHIVYSSGYWFANYINWWPIKWMTNTVNGAKRVNIENISRQPWDLGSYCLKNMLPNSLVREYKSFSMLNSAENEIYPAHKC